MGIVALPTACYAKGTLITAEKGHVLIEELNPGDLVLTATNGYQPVRWIGWRDIEFSAVPDLEKRINQPVLIAASAISDCVPCQDLFVSATHGILKDGAMTTAYNLVNGRNIVLLDDVASVTYFHLEFDEFEIIFANDCTAESFVDVGNRNYFDRCAGHPARNKFMSAVELSQMVRRKIAMLGKGAQCKPVGNMEKYINLCNLKHGISAYAN